MELTSPRLSPLLGSKKGPHAGSANSAAMSHSEGPFEVILSRGWETKAQVGKGLAGVMN